VAPRCRFGTTLESATELGLLISVEHSDSGVVSRADMIAQPPLSGETGVTTEDRGNNQAVSSLRAEDRPTQYALGKPAR